MAKAEVTLGDVPLAATQTTTWKLVTGVHPYTTIFSVHTSDWDKLKDKKGLPLTLQITDSRGQKTKIEEVYILHEAPSDSPHRVSFVVADRRWQWGYVLVARDYNMPRKTGTKTVSHNAQVPELQVNVDTFDYLDYSLKDGHTWTAQEALLDTLSIMLDDEDGPGPYRIESFPFGGGSSKGQFTLQGVSLRDQGDMALARLLSFIPGAQLYIDFKGDAVIFDGTNLSAAEHYFDSLPWTTWAGDRATMVDRKKIRPKKIIVNYVREIECLFTYSDDYGPTVATPNRDAPFLENVLPTVDLNTDVDMYDPQTGGHITKPLAPGNWVEVKAWLAAMDAKRPDHSGPWNFDNISHQWIPGDLEGVLGAQGKAGQIDTTENANVAQRVQALREHFRQTFRVNRRYMERFRDIRDVRAALLDPVTGARAPAAVWGQICIVPSEKGRHMAPRTGTDADNFSVTRNLDYLWDSTTGGKRIVDTTPGPQRVHIVDDELGIFTLETLASPFGTTGATYPCFIVDDNAAMSSMTRDLSLQDSKPTGGGYRVAGTAATSVFLAKTMKLKAMMTVVPASPNGTRQFHRIEVKAKDISSMFRSQLRIQDGEGPVLEIFVPPTEVTARFAWQDDAQAASTLTHLLGLADDVGDVELGDDGNLPGFLLVNEGTEDRHLTAHARALAAEVYAHFADSRQGAVTTIIPGTGLKLTGNMDSATIRVAQAPSGKIDVEHVFPGQQRPVSRFALMPDAMRQLVLKIVDFR